VEASRAVLAAASCNPALRGMGTTLVGAVLRNGHIGIASVGDSRCYSAVGGVVEMITEDQTWANEVGRHIGIDEARMRTHPMRHVLTMAIGVDAELRVHQYRVTPQPGLVLLFSSDGLHGVVDFEVIEKALLSERSLSDMAHYLIDAAKQAGGPDNVTVILVRWH
jgi:protein phosphatase